MLPSGTDTSTHPSSLPGVSPLVVQGLEEVHREAEVASVRSGEHGGFVHVQVEGLAAGEESREQGEQAESGRCRCHGCWGGAGNTVRWSPGFKLCSCRGLLHDRQGTLTQTAFLPRTDAVRSRAQPSPVRWWSAVRWPVLSDRSSRNSGTGPGQRPHVVCSAEGKSPQLVPTRRSQGTATRPASGSSFHNKSPAGLVTPVTFNQVLLSHDFSNRNKTAVFSCHIGFNSSVQPNLWHQILLYFI